MKKSFKAGCVGVAFFAACAFATPYNRAYAETFEVNVEREYHFSSDQTEIEAQKRVLALAKEDAIDQVATYITSSTLMQNYQVTEDNVNTYAAGIIKQLKQKPEYELIYEKHICKVKLVALVEVSEESLNDFIKAKTTPPPQPVAAPVVPVQPQPAPANIDGGYVSNPGSAVVPPVQMPAPQQPYNPIPFP